MMKVAFDSFLDMIHCCLLEFKVHTSRDDGHSCALMKMEMLLPMRNTVTTPFFHPLQVTYQSSFLSELNFGLLVWVLMSEKQLCKSPGYLFLSLILWYCCFLWRYLYVIIVR